jgi:rare lipoprotein A
MKLLSLCLLFFCLVFPIFAQENAVDFRQEGIASWYGIEFAGKLTASGEIFNPDDMTAAHPNLPFGTFLRVTNTHNGKQVIVRVNDRGPFAAARIIDLSEQAAERLDMIVTGTAPVIVEKINILPRDDQFPVSTTIEINPPALPQAQAVQQTSIPVQIDTTIESFGKNQEPAAQITGSTIKVYPGVPPAKSGKSYRIQVGSYKNAKNAVDAFDTLKYAALNPSYERYNDLYRVVLAQIPSNNVQSVIDTLAKAGFQEVLIKEE